MFAAKQARPDPTPTINLLLDHGANINAKDCYEFLTKEGGWTALMYAAYYGNLAATKVLLNRGADPNIASPSGKTALSIAQSRGYTQIADLIESYIQRAHHEDIAGNEGLDSGLRRNDGQKNIRRPGEIGTVPISVNAPDYREREHPDDFAVVVGVEKYAQNLPPAEFANEDASAFRAHLIALGVPARHIVYLSDERAGRSELVKNIERWLPKNVKPDSRVYFYFSGHGAPDPSTGNAYILPFSGDPSDLSDTAYPLSRLYASLGKLKVHHVIVALDSCFSGAGGRSVIAEGTRPLVNRVKEGVIPRNGKLLVLTASKSDQTSGVLKDKRHGTFTYYLLKGLNGQALNSQKHVTIDSLYSYLAPKVEDAAHLDDRDQDPQLLPKNARSAQSLTLR